MPNMLPIGLSVPAAALQPQVDVLAVQSEVD